MFSFSMSSFDSLGLKPSVGDFSPVGDRGVELFLNDSDRSFDCADIDNWRPCGGLTVPCVSFASSAGCSSAAPAPESKGTGSSSLAGRASGSAVVDGSGSGSVFSSFFFPGPFLPFPFFSCSYCWGQQMFMIVERSGAYPFLRRSELFSFLFLVYVGHSNSIGVYRCRAIRG
jgi:hypothetical protein